MSYLIEVIGDALAVIARFGRDFREVLWLTLWVGGVSTALSLLLGIPIGAWLGLTRSRWRRVWLTLVNTGMSLPPVLAGIVILIVIWDDGPLGALGLPFTVTAMIGAQTVLATPIAAGVTAGAIGGLPDGAREQIETLRLRWTGRATLAVREVWPGVLAAAIAAFGRVTSEVGAVLIVGGNIRGETRVLTTAIVQEARQARFGEALAFGIVLMAIALAINSTLTWAQTRGQR